MTNVNADNRLADLLIELKRHLGSCRNCKSAMVARDKTMLCEHTIGLILTAAWQYDHVIPRRLQVRRKRQSFVFACPDISVHGKSAEITAEPLIVVGVQDGMF